MISNFYFILTLMPTLGDGKPQQREADTPPRFSLDLRLRLLGALALVGLGAYAGLELRRAPKPELPRLAGGSDNATGREAPMDYDQFMSAFGVLGQEPAGIAFAKAFMAEPELAEIWNDFKQDKDTKALAEDLKTSDAFRGLLAKQGGAPEFKELVKRSLALIPSISQVLRSAGASSSSRLALMNDRMFLAKATRDPARSAGATTSAFAQTPRRSDGSGYSPAQQRTGPPPEQQTATQGALRQRRSLSPAAGGTPSSLPSIPAVRSAAESTTQPGPPNLIGSGNRLVDTKLATIANAQSSPMQRLLELFPWLSALSEAERQALLPLIDQHGLWGACFALRMYEKCRSACAGAGASCAPLMGWQSCLDFQNNNAAACVILCPQQPGCALPAGVGGRGGAGGGGNGRTGGRDCSACSDWVNTGGGRWRRNCPTGSGCDTSQNHQDNDPNPNQYRRCRPDEPDPIPGASRDCR